MKQVRPGLKLDTFLQIINHFLQLLEHLPWANECIMLQCQLLLQIVISKKKQKVQKSSL